MTTYLSTSRAPDIGGVGAFEQSRGRRKRRLLLWRLAGYASFLALWEFTSAFLIADFILPNPRTILARVLDIAASGELLINFGATVKTIALGLAIATVIGCAVGMARAISPWFEGLLGDWVTATMTTPGLVFALVSALIFGLGEGGPILATVVTTYSFIAVNITEGVRSLPKQLRDMGRAFNVSAGRIQRHIVVPFLAPYFFTALRYGFSTAWKIATLTEIIVGTKGIGFAMRRDFQSFDMAGFLAWVVIFFSFALFLERVVLQRQVDRFFRWRPEVAK